jgi:prepilin-type N-terminal cleavage/methylation domain-containing protein
MRLSSLLSRRPRPAFTLIELLVVMAIMAILMGLLLSGAQRAREAANSASCKNNLSQIGKAFMDYQTKNGAFPSGGMPGSQPNYDSNVPPYPLVGRQQTGSWAFQILPYLDHQDVWMNQAQAPSTTLPVFFCPTRRSAAVLTTGAAPSDYACSSLDGITAIGSLSKTGGVIQPGVAVRLLDMADGASNTLLAADKQVNQSQLGQPQVGDNGYTIGFDPNNVRHTTAVPAPDLHGSASTPGIFGSSHKGYINAVMADGSAHTITFEVNLAAFQALGTIANSDNINGAFN